MNGVIVDKQQLYAISSVKSSFKMLLHQHIVCVLVFSLPTLNECKWIMPTLSLALTLMPQLEICDKKRKLHSFQAADWISLKCQFYIYWWTKHYFVIKKHNQLYWSSSQTPSGIYINIYNWLFINFHWYFPFHRSICIF